MWFSRVLACRMEVRNLTEGKDQAAQPGAESAAPAAVLPEWLHSVLSRFPGAQAAPAIGGFDLRISLEQYLDVVRCLRDDHGFNYASCVTAVDWKDRLELVTQLYQLAEGLQNPPLVMVRVDGLPREGAEVPALTPLYPGLNWHERETYDMYGISFVGHPNPRRILLPDNWQGGYPLLKDFVDRRPKRPRLVRHRA